jgi:hypothetical protein
MVQYLWSSDHAGRLDVLKLELVRAVAPAGDDALS